MNWVVIKIKDIFSMNTGLSYKKGDLSINNKGVRIIRGGNIKPLEFSLLDNDYYIDTQFISSEQVYLKHNQLITPVSTSLEHIGKFARIDKDYDGVVAGGFIFQLTPFESSEIISKFLLFNLSSPLFYKQLKAITKLSGQALYNIPKTTLSELLIPLAPFEEQELITQKVEKLLEKVDEYAESYNRLEQLDKEFPDKLKKSILQYAMQGKLVEQDPNDESVEVLLEKIRAEKQKLFEEGKIKKKDLDISIVSQGDDNSYYGNIPMNWVVIKIKDIFSMNTGLSYKKGDLSINNKGVRIIRGGNIKPLEFSLLDNDYYIDTQFISSEQVYLKHNQLITPVSTSLEHIGKFARIDKDYDGVVAGGFIFQLTPFESSEIISKFLLFNLSSPLFYKQLKAITKLSGQALYNIPKTTLSELLIPLAPFEEQELITQKVEKLFEKVNQL
ncbi:type I restriction-modification system S protein [Streptococcus pneumoniae]|nr:type I restriction-modification system S protein [Streptococcus pneumoniae]